MRCSRFAQLALVASFLILATRSPGQSPRELPSTAMEASGHSLYREGNTLWAASPGYKARFDKGGVEFTPTLGPAAPANLPVRLQFESARRGDRQLATSTASAPRIADGRVHTDRSPDGSGRVLERYEIRDNEIEQTFVFTERPIGRGDLVVRMRIRTRLEANAGRQLDGLTLTGAHIDGGVRIGGVTGVDRDGVRAKGFLNYDGEHLELVLPDAFVEAATYPMVLDPVIGGIFSGGASFSDRRPDIAYNATNDFYLLVWEIHRSATDIDIWSTQIKSDNTNRTGVVVVSAPGIQSHPCIASLAATDMFLVAWQDNGAGNWDIRGRAIEAGTKALSPITDIAATAADEISPDLAGDATKTDDKAACLWDDESFGIRSANIEVPSPVAITVGPVIPIAAGPGASASHPAIPKSGGLARRIAVAWESGAASMTVQAFTLELQLASTVLVFPYANALPAVDGDGTDFIVVIQRPESPTSPQAQDIWGIGLSTPVAPNGSMQLRAGPLPIADNPNDDEARPTITYTGNRFVAAWADQDANATTAYRCTIQNLLPNCTSCGSRWTVSRTAGRRVDWPAVASTYSGGGTGDGAWFLFQEEDLSTQRSLVMTARYAAVVGGPVQTIAPSCSGGGTLSATGAFAFGERVSFQLSGAASSGSLGVLLAGFPGSRQQFPCGTCQILVTPIMIGVPIRNGAMQFSTQIPCDMRLLDYELDVQVLVAPSGTSPCPILPNLGASNILRATIRD